MFLKRVSEILASPVGNLYHKCTHLQVCDVSVLVGAAHSCSAQLAQLSPEALIIVTTIEHLLCARYSTTKPHGPPLRLRLGHMGREGGD